MYCYDIYSNSALLTRLSSCSIGHCDNLTDKRGLSLSFPGFIKESFYEEKMDRGEENKAEKCDIEGQKCFSAREGKRTPCQIGLGQFVVAKRLWFLGNTTVNDVWQAHPYWLLFTHKHTHRYSYNLPHTRNITNKCVHVCIHIQTTEKEELLCVILSFSPSPAVKENPSLAGPLPLFPHSLTNTSLRFPATHN